MLEPLLRVSLGSSLSKMLTNLVLWHTTFTCASKPGCLIVTSGSTPQTVRHKMKKKMYRAGALRSFSGVAHSQVLPVSWLEQEKFFLFFKVPPSCLPTRCIWRAAVTL